MLVSVALVIFKWLLTPILATPVEFQNFVILMNLGSRDDIHVNWKIYKIIELVIGTIYGFIDVTDHVLIKE